MGGGKYDHVTPLLMDLHWQRVPERVKFKLWMLVHRCLLERRRDIWQSWQCLSPVVLVVACARCHLLILSFLPLAVQQSVTVRSLTAYHMTFEHLHHHSTRLRNIWNPTSLNCLSPACRACDYVYIDYVRRSRSSSYRLLRPINIVKFTLHYISDYFSVYNGVRQGGVLSPILFCVYIDNLLQKLSTLVLDVIQEQILLGV